MVLYQQNTKNQSMTSAVASKKLGILGSSWDPQTILLARGSRQAMVPDPNSPTAEETETEKVNN